MAAKSTTNEEWPEAPKWRFFVADKLHCGSTVVLVWALLVFLLACTPLTEEGVQEPNLTQAAGLHSTLWFQQSPECEALYRQCYRQATFLLAQNVQHYRDSDSLAIIIDLDETVLDNSAYQASLIMTGERYAPQTWNDWVRETRATLLPGARQFLLRADSLGTAIFYLSNRYEETRSATLQNMRALNLPQARETRLLLRTETSDKTERRAAVQTNYRVILGLGDQLTDFSENIHPAMRDSMARHFVLMPNPMYGGFTHLPDSLKAAPAARQNAHWAGGLQTALP